MPEGAPGASARSPEDRGAADSPFSQLGRRLFSGEWTRTEPRRPLVSIIVTTWNQLQYTRMCLESLRRFTPAPYELIVVNNGSRDGTADYLASLQDVVVVSIPDNRGFPHACNRGIEAASGEYVVLLNNDTLVVPGWLQGMLRCIEADPGVGMVGPCSNFVTGPQLVQPAPYRTPDELTQFALEFTRNHFGHWFELQRLVGFCLLIRRSVIDLVGGLDEGFGQGNFDDDDYSLRVCLAGYRLMVAGDVFIHHFGNRTYLGNGVDLAALGEENRRKFQEKWGLPNTVAQA